MIRDIEGTYDVEVHGLEGTFVAKEWQPLNVYITSRKVESFPMLQTFGY